MKIFANVYEKQLKIPENRCEHASVFDLLYII